MLVMVFCRTLVIGLAITLLIPLLPLTSGGDDGYPYELKDYEELDIPNAIFVTFALNDTHIIYYSMNHEPEYRSIYITKVDGIDPMLLYKNRTIYIFDSAVSNHPSKNMIIFEDVFEGIKVLFFDDDDWNNISTHTTGISGKNPTFSNTGTHIGYAHNQDRIGYGDIWIVDINFTNPRRITNDNNVHGHPSFSYDDNEIVYLVWSENKENEIWICDVNGTYSKKILDDSWYPGSPTFMPNGQILFESARLSPHSSHIGVPSIWIMDRDGSNKTLVIPSFVKSVGSNTPAVNRNGTEIIFENGVGDNFHILKVIDVDRDGIWQDSDGDHVADVCDKYPDDPTRGYYTDDSENNWINGFESWDLISSMIVIIGGAQVAQFHTRRTRGGTI